MSKAPRSRCHPNRRKVLAALTLATGGMIGSAIAVPVLGFILTPLGRRATRVWRELGRLEEFPVGETVQVRYQAVSGMPWIGFIAESAAWVRRERDGRIMALSAYCTHTGCPVEWKTGAQMFICPCHGGAFHRDGRVAAGPPPRPLPLHEVRVREGRLEMKTLPLVATARRT
jgi:menaquinol-cytochrome c reductase iron-sulfur subunit